MRKILNIVITLILVILSENKVVAQEDTLIYMPLNMYDFGPAGPYEKKPVAQYPEDILKTASTENIRKTDNVAEEVPSTMKYALRTLAIEDVTDYAVGSIQYQEDVTPSGGKVYNIPITISPIVDFASPVSIQYNSQTRNGIAGYGWNIAGLSSITISNKNLYYNGEVEAADIKDPDAVYQLDGVPIVQNDDYTSAADYPLETAEGHILVQKHVVDDVVRYFSVIFPDGSRATYGDTGNSSPKAVYPIMEKTDKLGNKTIYNYYTSSSEYWISDIFFVNKDGDTNESYLGRVTFEYEDRTDHYSRYVACEKVEENKILKHIISESTCLNTICEYELAHELRDGVNLLTSIRCMNSEGEQLRPLNFSYGENDAGATTKQFTNVDNLILESYFANNQDVKIIDCRGKFTGGSYNDGVMSYPQYSNYSVIATLTKGFLNKTTHYLFGSTYSPDQEILVAPRMSEFNYVNRSIKAGEGFQSIDAVDVDGDGIDEIVRVNFGGTSVSTGTTQLNISIYKYDRATCEFLVTKTFNIDVNGVYIDDELVSPRQRCYRYGDFIGDGTVQLVTISCNTDPVGNTVTSYASIIDLNSGVEISEQELFSFAPEDNVFCIDFDSDGKTELCHAVFEGINVYNLSDNTFTFTKLITGISRVHLKKNVHFTDLNRDGYVDIVVASDYGTEAWRVCLYNGNRLEGKAVDIATVSDDDDVMLFDLNHDNLPDIIHRAGNTVYVYLNDNSTFIKENRITSNISFPVNCRFIQSSLLGYDTMSDFITIDNYSINVYDFSQDLAESRLLTGFTNSLGAHSVNSYEDLALSDDVYLTDASVNYNIGNGYTKRRFPLQLLRNTRAYLSSEEQDVELVSDLCYTYYDACVHNKGLGFCGFGKIRTVDFTTTYDSELTSVETKNPEKKGITIKREKSFRLAQNSPFETIEYTYDGHSTTYGKMNPRLIETVKKDILKNFSTTTTYTYDQYDYPKSIKTTYSEGTRNHFEEIQSIIYQHKTNTDQYILGSVLSSTNFKTDLLTPIFVNEESDFNSGINQISSADENPIISIEPADPINPGDPIKPIDPIFPIDTNIFITNPFEQDLSIKYLVEKQVFTYDDKMMPLSRIDSVGVQTSEMSKKQEIRWTYSPFGKVLTEMSAPYDVNVFVGKAYTYDGDGQVSSMTNELNQTTVFFDYNKFGKPTKITDYAGRLTTIVYDDWGNQMSTTMADGTTTSAAVTWGGTGVYTVTRSSTGRPAEIIHYDALGREIRKGSQRFDGQWIFTDKEYGKNGMVVRESLPFKDSGSAILWNTYSYDNYLRPLSYTHASGNITTWAYDGNRTTESKNGVWSIKTTDCTGRVTIIQDAGGTICNMYRVDGKPYKVSLNDDVITSFHYDVFGRRTGIDDPSAGTQTDTVIFNPDGSSVATHMNPNGSIITYKDRLGRTTKIDRPGEYTTDYSYDSNGLLVSEISSNGTSKIYQYDAYDRVVSVTETVPDGKWLRKSYTYLSGSNVSSITYETHDGVIATEYFEYSNGTNVKVELETTDVFHLTSENEFGQPTCVITGDITRTYSYDSYGHPVRRTMGTVMDCSYSFDPQRGNLLSRTDNLHLQSESFGYDDLNRLTSIDTRAISYTGNGNIIRIDDVGDMTYGNQFKPYQVTSLSLEENVVPSRVQDITYTCYSRPSIMTEGGRSAAFTYNGDGARVKMNVSDGATSVLSRYYIGNQYELDVTPNGTTERLYLGGDAYSAPAVYIKEGSGTWTFYNIGRDYLGNITHIATEDGTLVEENSYDPWGRLRNPETKEIYSLGTEPELMLGRGYTGHEHLTWFGLINMNARLYDPVLGRFLSPDPFVQMPDFTQNFNRYSYCLNNPLVYVDENGELWSAITAIYRLPDTIIRGVLIPFFVGFSDTRKAGQMASSAWQEYGQTVANAAKIDYGIIYTDKNKSAGGRIWEFFSRFLWQPKQFALGYLASGLYNLFGGVKSVSLYGGATVSESYASGWGDISLGNYIIGQKGIYADPANPDFQHEYGHYIQSQRSGYAYFPRYGVPSLFSKSPHDYHPVEQDANIRAFNYFSKHVSGFNSVDAYGNYNGMWDLGYSPILGLKPTDTTVLDKRLKWSFWDLLAGFVPIVGDFAGGGIRSHYDRKKY